MPLSSPITTVRQASTWSIVWGIALIVLGMIAIASPGLAAVAVNGILAWLIMFAGIVHVVVAFHADRAGSFLWRLLVGIAYICFGGYLLANPLLAVASLTLLLASLFLVEGIFDVVMFFRMRSSAGAIWVLFDGIVTLLLGGLIYMHWPSSSAWAIGTLVGVSMIMSGVSRLMLSLAVRRVASAIAPPSSPKMAA